MSKFNPVEFTLILEKMDILVKRWNEYHSKTKLDKEKLWINSSFYCIGSSSESIFNSSELSDTEHSKKKIW